MDDKKDIQTYGRISAFLDGTPIHTNPFGENRSADRAYRRAERLAGALYLITNHVSLEEPIRNRIRLLSTTLLCLILDSRDEMRSPASQKMRATMSVIRELVSSVRILAISGSLSIQNVGIVVEALDELGMFLYSSQKSLLSESVRITREDLLDVNEKDTTKDTLKDKYKTYSTSSIIPTKRTNTEHIRGDSILEVLKSGGTLSIREITSNLPEYSEKMIQRELSLLVLNDRVIKTGDKRWSRYSINVS